MKIIVIACVGLLLMFTYGCSSEDAKEAAETTKETVIETQEKAAEMASDAVSATKDAAVEAKDKAAEMINGTNDTSETSDTVKKPRKRPALEGC